MNKFTKFQIGFHIFIILVAIGIVYSYVRNDFQVAYVIIGSVIAINSAIKLYKLFKNAKFINEFTN